MDSYYTEVNDFDNIIRKLPAHKKRIAKLIEELGFTHVLMNEIRHKNRGNIRTIIKNVDESHTFSSAILKSIERSVCFIDGKITRLHYILKMIGTAIYIGGTYIALDYYSRTFHDGDYKFDPYIYTRCLHQQAYLLEDGHIQCYDVVISKAEPIFKELLPGLKYERTDNSIIIYTSELKAYLSQDGY